MRIKLLCITVTLAFAAIAASGMEPASNRDTAKKDGLSSPPGGRSHKTVFFNLKLFDGHIDTGKRINRRFRGRLAALRNCELLARGPGGAPPCDSADCARVYGKTAGAHRVIYGYVSLKTDTEKARLADTGVEKYIIKTEKRETYLIKIKLLDVETGEILAETGKKSGPENLDTTVDEMVAELAPRYEPRAEIKPVKTEEPEKTIAVDKTKRETPPGSFLPREYSLGLGFSFMAPMGDFRDVASFASGAAIEARIGGVPALPNFELRPLLGCYFYAAEDESVDSYRSLYLSLSAGYRFTPYRGITATPLLGGGYILHFVESDAGSTTYGDPLLSVRLGFDYLICPGLTLTAVPGYILFFEQNGFGMYPVFDLGVTYSF